MAKKTAEAPTPRFNLSVQTLRVAHEALQTCPKTNSQSMMVCAQAMNEIEVVLAALPQPPAPAPEATDDTPAPAPAPAPKKGKNRK